MFFYSLRFWIFRVVCLLYEYFSARIYFVGKTKFLLYFRTWTFVLMVYSSDCFVLLLLLLYAFSIFEFEQLPFYKIKYALLTIITFYYTIQKLSYQITFAAKFDTFIKTFSSQKIPNDDPPLFITIGKKQTKL